MPAQPAGRLGRQGAMKNPGRLLAGPAPAALSLAALTIAIAVVTAACSFLPGATADPRTELQREVAAHAARWELAAIDSYSFTITRGCFCPPESSGPFRVTVESGAVTAVTYDGQPVAGNAVAGFPLTIDAVFVALLALGPEAALRGTWDEARGFPTDVSVDPIPNAADDEFTIRIEAFEPAG